MTLCKRCVQWKDDSIETIVCGTQIKYHTVIISDCPQQRVVKNPWIAEHDLDR